MNVAFAALAFAPALAIGSFLNVVVARVPERRSIVSPRSACPGCGHVLAPWENLPLVSFFRRFGSLVVAHLVFFFIGVMRSRNL